MNAARADDFDRSLRDTDASTRFRTSFLFLVGGPRRRWRLTSLRLSIDLPSQLALRGRCYALRGVRRRLRLTSLRLSLVVVLSLDVVVERAAGVSHEHVMESCFVTAV